MNQSLFAIDLFSGCGGLTVGLKKAGFIVMAAVDNDEVSQKIYSKNHPEVLHFSDSIKDLSPDKVRLDLKLKKGDLDLLAGCPPCQGFSTLRTLNGVKRNNDINNDLIFDFLFFIKSFMPKTVLMENVPNLKKDVRFEEFTSALEKLGYCMDFSVLNAEKYGVPQRRKRLILVASKLGQININMQEEKLKTVRDTISSMAKPNDSKDPLHNYKRKTSEFVLEIIKNIPQNGGSRASLPENLRLNCHKNTDGFKDVYGRMKWDDVSPTITSGCANPSKGRFLHPVQNRPITLREASLLQSFPKNYKFNVTTNRGKLAFCIGNALPPKFAQRQAASIAKHISEFNTL